MSELFQKYLDAEPYFEKAKIHLDNELTEVSQKYLPQNKIDILNQKMLQLNQKLATRWLNIVEEASKRFIPKNIHDNE
ncbi:MAG: hypothetical protein EAZ55_07485 [Cytophagales bacterium]|nr:MAG: hypothetical protein EAZ55_07485 [Cytophagales bacterium]